MIIMIPFQGLDLLFNLDSIIISSLRDLVKMKNERRIGGFRLTAMMTTPT